MEKLVGFLSPKLKPLNSVVELSDAVGAVVVEEMAVVLLLPNKGLSNSDEPPDVVEAAVAVVVVILLPNTGLSNSEEPPDVVESVVAAVVVILLPNKGLSNTEEPADVVVEPAVAVKLLLPNNGLSNSEELEDMVEAAVVVLAIVVAILLPNRGLSNNEEPTDVVESAVAVALVTVATIAVFEISVAVMTVGMASVAAIETVGLAAAPPAVIVVKFVGDDVVFNKLLTVKVIDEGNCNADNELVTAVVADNALAPENINDDDELLTVDGMLFCELNFIAVVVGGTTVTVDVLLASVELGIVNGEKLNREDDVVDVDGAVLPKILLLSIPMEAGDDIGVEALNTGNGDDEVVEIVADSQAKELLIEELDIAADNVDGTLIASIELLIVVAAVAVDKSSVLAGYDDFDVKNVALGMAEVDDDEPTL